MSETEKQEGQKTVVAFITGLLIGGLLVWVFSSSPEEKAVDTNTETDTTEKVETEGTEDVTTNIRPTTAGEDKVSKPVEVIGEGKLEVADQKAGVAVVIKSASYPTKGGWVVVRELMDGTPGNVLGAARYSVDETLSPTEVNLLRGTTVGSSYQVVFYADNGDKVFDLGDDTLIEGTVATFKAQ